MNEWLNKTWVIRVISLLLAIITFVVISLDNQDTRTADIGGFDSIFNSSQEVQVLEDIPVNIQIDDQQYVVSGVPQTVAVTLQGTVSVVQSTATQRNFDVFVNLEDLEPGTHTVPLEYEGISNRLTVEISPKEIEVLIEERAAGEYVVDIDFTNQEHLEPGFEIIQATVVPEMVEITSSQNVIDRIAMVIVYVDVEGLGENMTFNEVPIRVYDSEGNQLSARIEPDVVSVDVEVANPNKIVPVEIETQGQLPDDLRIVSLELDQDEVRIFGSEESLEEIASIQTIPLDLSDITETTTREIELDIPESVRFIADSTLSVTIEVEERDEAVIEGVEIDVENETNNSSTIFIDPSTGMLDLVVSGYQTDLANLTASDFQLSVDVDGLEEGEYELPIAVAGPNDLEFSLAMDQVTLEIQ